MFYETVWTWSETCPSRHCSPQLGFYHPIAVWTWSETYPSPAMTWGRLVSWAKTSTDSTDYYHMRSFVEVPAGSIKSNLVATCPHVGVPADIAFRLIAITSLAHFCTPAILDHGVEATYPGATFNRILVHSILGVCCIRRQNSKEIGTWRLFFVQRCMYKRR